MRGDTSDITTNDSAVKESKVSKKIESGNKGTKKYDFNYKKYAKILGVFAIVALVIAGGWFWETFK